MNKREKEVIQSQLDKEKAVLKKLELQYQRALTDIINKTKILQADIDMLQEAGEADDKTLSMVRSKVYQKQYQQALQRQIIGILDKLHSDEYTTIQAFLNGCYEDGFIGTMYALQGQGIPIIAPIDTSAAVKAVQLDSKVVEGYYKHLGVDFDNLKKVIPQEVSRGIASSLPYTDIARNLNSVSQSGLFNAKRIARTEGHRIQQQSADDARQAAKKKGADVVKQWDSTLDGRTRDSHRRVDGEIRENDEKFSNGLRFAGDPNGGAAEVINCRCVTLTRARWALDEEELETLKDRAAFFGLDKTKNFEDYKKKYLKAAEETVKAEKAASKFVPAKNKAEAEDFAKQFGVKYVDYSKLPLETANSLNAALNTLPDDVRPVFVGDSATLEKYWGGKLPRSSKNYYGVTIDTFDGIHLGFDEELRRGVVDDIDGYMVGISSSYRTADKIKASKIACQERYKAKHNGHTWFFNVDGETTPFHEMGHVYINTKGLPNGFKQAAEKWATETKCDMLSNPNEAWAEAWASYHTGINEIPDYIKKFIVDAANK